jgi:hypothetical protein
MTEPAPNGETRQRRRSRFPKPGSLASGWWERMPGYVSTHGQVVVMATSAHRHTITENEALALLRAEYGPQAGIDRIGTWRSVTARDMDCGDVGDAAPGDWSEGGSGTRWVDVAYPDDAALNGGFGSRGSR